MKKNMLVTLLLIIAASCGFAQTHPVSEPAEKAKGLQKELKLTNHQTAEVTAVYEESARKFDKIKAEEHGNSDKMLVALKPLRAATIKKIKAVLTRSQAVKYDAMVKNTNATGGNGWSDGWSSTSGN